MPESESVREVYGAPWARIQCAFVFFVVKAGRKELSVRLASICPRIGQFFQPPPGEDCLKFTQKSVVNNAIGRNCFTALQLKRSALEVRHSATRLLNKQHPGCRVPGIQVELPESIEPSRGYRGQIQCR